MLHTSENYIKNKIDFKLNSEGRTNSTFTNYDSLDDKIDNLYYYMQFIKFGFGRASDIVSLHIRRGRMTRAQGIDLVKIHDGQFPWEYLGKDLKDILDPIGMTVDEFIAVCDQFTNKQLFKTDANGILIKDKNGNLEKNNYDND